MACRKCGSDWKTATGRDCQSCPHCNKIQRHKARKAGRWVEVTEQATCKNCGKQFTNVGANVGKAKCCSPECAEACKKAWSKAYSADYNSGLRRGTQASKRLPAPICKRCGQLFKRKYSGSDANLYCSKRCFYDARNAGDHEWDRTNQLKATWHKLGPYSSAPSVMAIRHIAKCWKHIFKCQNLLPKMMALAASRPKCEVCGGLCKQMASRFCSHQCLTAWRGVRKCETCGIDVPDSTAYSRARCAACRHSLLKETRRRHRRKYGKNHRQRAKLHGVKYTPIVVRAIYERDGWRCQMCKRQCKRHFLVSKLDRRPHPRSPTLDHIVPLSLGGNHNPSNVQLACFECNTRKAAKACGQLRLALT